VRSCHPARGMSEHWQRPTSFLTTSSPMTLSPREAMLVKNGSVATGPTCYSWTQTMGWYLTATVTAHPNPARASCSASYGNWRDQDAAASSLITITPAARVDIILRLSIGPTVFAGLGSKRSMLFDANHTLLCFLSARRARRHSRASTAGRRALERVDHLASGQNEERPRSPEQCV
jgi:hypothetical protein